MDETALWPVLREYWRPVCWSKEATDKPLAVKLLDEKVVVCRIAGQVRAYQGLCIHRGTPLSLGWVEGETLVCAYHGWAYEAGGKCVRIPSVPPDHPIPRKTCLTPYPAEEAHGLVWVCLSEAPRAPIPAFPPHDDPDYRIIFRNIKFWKCGAARSIENFVDFGRFPWVHEGILGDREHTLVSLVDIRREGESLRFELQNIPDGLHRLPHVRNYRLTRPFTIFQWKVEENGNTEVFFLPGDAPLHQREHAVRAGRAELQPGRPGSQARPGPGGAVRHVDGGRGGEAGRRPRNPGNLPDHGHHRRSGRAHRREPTPLGAAPEPGLPAVHAGAGGGGGRGVGMEEG